MNKSSGQLAVTSVAHAEEPIDIMSFKDVASFLGIGEMTAYQDEQKALASFRKTFDTADVLVSEPFHETPNAYDLHAAARLHPQRKNWFPVRHIADRHGLAPCLTTTAIVFQLLYRRNAQYRPAVFTKHHGCWRQIALVRQLIFFQARLLAQLDRPLPTSALSLDSVSLGLQIEMEEGMDAYGSFRLPVPTAFFVMAPAKDCGNAE
jgi:hypothetical protein